VTPETRDAIEGLEYAVAAAEGSGLGYVTVDTAQLRALLTAFDTQLSTSQAADLIGVSRPTIVRFLDSGRLPFTQPGKHRRIRLADLLEFKKTITHDRHKPLTDEPCGVITTQRGRQLVDEYRAHRTRQRPRGGAQ